MTTYRAVTEQECDRLLALCEQKDLEISRLQRAVDWCLDKRNAAHILVHLGQSTFEVPADLADIIKPRESGDARERAEVKS